MSRIKELREALGKKQEEIAMLCGVTQSTVSLWELGKTAPRKKALEKLCKRFGVSAGYLLGLADDDSMQEQAAPPPKTPEARLISAGVDSMPEEQRKRAVEIFNLMFSEFHDK